MSRNIITIVVGVRPIQGVGVGVDWQLSFGSIIVYDYSPQVDTHARVPVNNILY